MTVTQSSRLAAHFCLLTTSDYLALTYYCIASNVSSLMGGRAFYLVGKCASTRSSLFLSRRFVDILDVTTGAHRADYLYVVSLHYDTLRLRSDGISIA
jgi:hypothetical protein